MCKNVQLQPLSSGDAAKFGQGRFIANAAQTKWLRYHKSIAFFRQKPKMSKENLEWLQNNCIDLMMALLRAKFTRDTDCGKRLLQFADQIDDILFTEHTKNDRIWADNLDGSGTNYLGKLLTIRLHELINDSRRCACSTFIPDRDYLNRPNNECVTY